MAVPASVPRVIPNDPDDDHVIACAIAAEASLIVSGDRHILQLRQYQNIPILNATEAVQFIEQQT